MSNEGREVRVTIVGAGIAGLRAALRLLPFDFPAEA
jgi:succinate dehydrogenase/fumarate reductase flavoprotein subunit